MRSTVDVALVVLIGILSFTMLNLGGNNQARSATATADAAKAAPGAAPGSPATQPADRPIQFVQETLPNGLRVIYAPMHTAPVVHVRVLYHVGSKDERSDRQGFAHMFEHMMFRGSAHVAPEQHMKMINMVGGQSNAFTSFDQTVYVNTVPSNYLETALYLEADRMASFKVSPEIYATERNVVTEEWRMGRNRPYGTSYEDFSKVAYTKHSYRWTPIGNMDNLRDAQPAELQQFFNKYYVPNNAVLVIAGDSDVDTARKFVGRYFGWIPAGEKVVRDIPAEPEQQKERRVEMAYPVPAQRIMIGYKLPPYSSPDQDALGLLGMIMSDGRTSRLDRLLVLGENPLCVDVSAGAQSLEDSGMFVLHATVLKGKSVAEVEKKLDEAVADVVKNGVTAEELERVKTRARVGTIRGRQTCTDIAGQLGEEALYTGNPDRVNTELARMNAVTAADVQRVAAKYLQPQRATTMVISTGGPPVPIAVKKAAEDTGEKIAPRAIKFPEGYPTQPPLAEAKANPEFKKGVEAQIDGVKVIVMEDHTLPLVNWGLTMRRGSDSDPAGKEGLAALTAELVRRGSKGVSFAELNQELESRGIGIEVNAGDDTTRLTGSCTSDQFERGVAVSRTVLMEPTFPADEFAKIKEQTINRLRLSQNNAGTVAGDELAARLYGNSPLGVRPTPRSVESITLDDVKDCYARLYRPNDAILVVSGDVTVEQGQAAAKKILDGWEAKAMAAVDYTLPAPGSKRSIIVVDRPEGRQATIRIGVRAYDIRADDEKFAGSVANSIMSSGIEGRFGKYVRAEKGLVYSVWGVFQPGRHGGAFLAAADTKLETTADTVQAICDVIARMRKENVTDAELADARLRVSGNLIMQMQTIGQQAQYRTDTVLNDYPIDYFDKYPERAGKVTAEQVKAVMNHYVLDDRMTVVVVAPAEQVKEQLSKLGEVTVVPMPGSRE